MQEDFHYFATYSAAYLAGYDHEESLQIAYSAQLVDLCSRTFLEKIRGPLAAATTQTQPELAESNPDIIGLQDITRIWASFHFLPGDLYAEKAKTNKKYLQKYRLICKPNSDLLIKTVQLAKDSSYQAIGLAMHVLADTWAHMNFAGTPSLVINNTNYYFYEEMPDGTWEPVVFHPRPNTPDDLEKRIYVGSLYQVDEDSIMNLGHGRAGHFPDYSFMKYKYLPAWGDYEEVIKDNPSDYLHAFAQMIHALKYLRGDIDAFQKGTYDWEAIEPYRDRIETILKKRQLDACADWKAFGESLSHETIEDFDLNKYQDEYMQADQENKDQTVLGKYILAAMEQKSMVTKEIYSSGSRLAGESVEYKRNGFQGIEDFIALIKHKLKGDHHE